VVTFTLQVANAWPGVADGTTTSDPVVPGLNRTAFASYAATGGAVCPSIGAVELTALNRPRPGDSRVAHWRPDHAGTEVHRDGDGTPALTYPRLGSRPISEIKPQKFLVTMKRIAGRPAPAYCATWQVTVKVTLAPFSIRPSV